MSPSDLRGMQPAPSTNTTLRAKHADCPLSPWYKVALPHSDIREGRLDESVFAANIWAVRQDNAPTTYLDPEQFFAKTYLTGGLTKVLRKAGNALCGMTEGWQPHH